MNAGSIATELWWTNMEIPPSVSFHLDSPCSYIICGMNDKPLVAAVQRCSLTPSTISSSLSPSSSSSSS
jgi:hypothetical protein